jgi:L-asparaginase
VNWEDPFIQGDSLVPHKARILLMLGLKKTKDPRELQRMFNEY